jgi:hypothetical protein
MTQESMVPETLTVHEVGLAAAIRTNDAGEIEEGSDPLFARVGLEVFEFQVGHWHFLEGWREVLCGRRCSPVLYGDSAILAAY